MVLAVRVMRDEFMGHSGGAVNPLGENEKALSEEIMFQGMPER